MRWFAASRCILRIVPLQSPNKRPADADPPLGSGVPLNPHLMADGLMGMIDGGEADVLLRPRPCSPPIGPFDAKIARFSTRPRDDRAATRS